MNLLITKSFEYTINNLIQRNTIVTSYSFTTFDILLMTNSIRPISDRKVTLIENNIHELTTFEPNWAALESQWGKKCLKKDTWRGVNPYDKCFVWRQKAATTAVDEISARKNDYFGRRKLLAFVVRKHSINNNCYGFQLHPFAHCHRRHCCRKCARAVFDISQ